ncbi:helicase C-terminal domain-containing protein [Phlebopus sp. FC_14]|nr:helicase C-terminal domain-containing protein [Phlebopus sp. FC_14]
MTHNDLALPTPEQFPAFPYDPPYSIQTDLMKHVYTSIENKHVTIVESPTGTGKTLSLLCSSLTWLTDERERARKEPSWVATQAIQMRQRGLEAQDREYEERLVKARKAEASLRALARARVTKRQRVAVNVAHDQDDDEDVFLPDDDAKDEGDNISPAVRALMAKWVLLGSLDHVYVFMMWNRLDKDSGSHLWAEAEPTCTKIYYASRTHSQLTQVLPELRKLKFHLVSNHFSDLASKGSPHESGAGTLSHQKKRAIEADDAEQNVEIDGRQWRTVSLGSRKQLCINEGVRSSSGDWDERCRELREGKGEKRCQYLPSGQDTKLLDLRDQILATPKDIEDLAAAGHHARTCPYYASRRAISQAELVTLPYNLLLQKTAREALGIDLTNQVVIIDEAHNLIPTLLSLSTVRVTSDTLTTSLNQVAVYYQKFRTRLSTLHSIHLKRLINYLGAMQKVVDEWKLSKRKQGVHGANSKIEVLTIPDFVQRLGRKVDGINLLEIETYLRQSKIAQKITGYADLASAKDREGLKHERQSAPRTSPPLHAVEALMLGLAGAREDGRVILSSIRDDPKIEQVEIKYQLLNPSTNFREVIDAARSVILAGGTMSPMSDVIAQLFSSTPSERISTFSCGHIIPRSHVQTLLVTRGPGGSSLEFKYAQQSDRQMLSELGQIILNFCNVIPGGLVVFFPSYLSLSFARTTWDAAHLLHKFGMKKKVFLEPQESSAVESTLRSYADACAGRSDKKVGPTGAILFAVVGAKLSEGLNFSDDLARAVIVVGLPFANKNSPELQERMRYVNEVETKLGNKRQCGLKDAASELYENMCMNAVNQSIGRAIRHRSDWASLILIDLRYSSPSIGSKLPSWIKGDLVVCETFGKTMRHLVDFYREKKLQAIVAG